MAIVVVSLTFQLELGAMHTSYIVRVHVQSDRGLLFDSLNHCATEVTGSVSGLGKTEHSSLIIRSHASFGGHENLKNLVESLLKGLSLLFEQFVTILGSDSLILVDLESPISNALVGGEVTYMRDGKIYLDIFRFNNN